MHLKRIISFDTSVCMAVVGELCSIKVSVDFRVFTRLKSDLQEGSTRSVLIILVSLV